MLKLKQRLSTIYQTMCARLRRKTYFFSLASIILFGVIYSFFFQYPSAFGAPTQTPGVGSGAIGVDTATNNLSIGTATPAADSKLLIVSPSTGASDFALKVLQLTTNNPILVVRSDGNVGIGNSSPTQAPLSVTGNIYASGSFTGTVSAGNITSGVFGSNSGGGNYAFPSSLGVGYASQVGLPQTLSVSGGGYFSSYVGIGGPVSGYGFLTVNGNPGIDLVGNGATAIGGDLNIGVNSGWRQLISANWYYGGSPATDRYTRTGGAVQISFGTQSVAGFGAGDIDFLAAPSGTAGSAISFTRAMTIKSTGNVGIGTTAPGTTLDVNDSARVRSQLWVGPQSGSGYFQVSGTSGGTKQLLGVGIAGVTNGFSITTNASNGIVYSMLTGGQAQGFYQSAAGNVGIGTANPTSTLTVVGEIKTTSGGVRFPDGTLQTTAAGGGSSLWAASGANINNTNSGNVGIGIADPGSYKLNVQGGTMYFKSGSSDYSSILFRDGAIEKPDGDRDDVSVDINYAGYSSGFTRFRDVSVYNGKSGIVLKVDGSSGNVGIGTASPGYTLTVNNPSSLSSIGLSSVAGGATTYKLMQGITAVNNGGFSLYDVTNSATRLAIDPFGNVGIGMTVGPTYKLDVASAGTTTARFGTAATDGIVVGGGAGKITAGTYDPLYTIHGTKYATYLPGMTGQKEETTGVVRCQMSDVRCQTVIDFNAVPEGSDLWLFSKTANLKNNFDAMTVLLTPAFDGNVWYEKNNKNLTLKIFATTNYQLPTTNLEVSYRLTAPRFDAAEWSNYSNENNSGLIIND